MKKNKSRVSGKLEKAEAPNKPNKPYTPNEPHKPNQRDNEKALAYANAFVCEDKSYIEKIKWIEIVFLKVKLYLKII